MKINVFSKFENLIIFNEQQIIIDASKKEIEVFNDFNLLIYPLETTKNNILLPFACKFFIENSKVNCYNKHVNVLNFQDFAEIEILPFEIFDQSSQCLINNFSFKHGTQDFEIFIYSNCLNNFIVKCGTVVFKTSLPNITECAFYKISSFIVLSYFNGKQNLLIFDINKNIILLNSEVMQFELDSLNNKISIIIPLNDSLNHGLIKFISLNDSFNIDDEFLTYLSDENYADLFDEFVFFDCVKAKNFAKARSFLSDELSSLISDNSLCDYFKGYKDIKQTKNKNQFYLIPLKSNETVPIIEFEKSNSKINNIKILYK